MLNHDFSTCGHHPSTQEAYETIASGIIRPVNREQSVCYSIKCIDMNLPYFTLGEYEYIISLVLIVIENVSRYCIIFKFILNS